MDTAREGARDRGYVETVFGRRLHVPEINRATSSAASTLSAPQSTHRCRAPRPTSSSARCSTSTPGSPKTGVPVRMIMQVHDELVFEVANEAVGDVAPLIRERMGAAAELSVPLVVDVGEGDNWDEAH